MLSSGIYVPTASASDRSAASSSKTSPFAFPAYDPPERMDVDRHAEEEGAVDVDMDLGHSLDPHADILEPNDIPVSLTDQWKDYIR